MAELAPQNAPDFTLAPWAQSKTIGGVSEIAVLSPIRTGCPDGERRTHEERLRATIADLARRHGRGLPTELNRVPSIHFGRMIILRPEQYLVCSEKVSGLKYYDRQERATKDGGQIPMPIDEVAQVPGPVPTFRSWLLTLVEFDGDLKLYLRDIAHFLGGDFDLVFRDCEDYPGTKHFEEFWQWIRRYQINIDLFYATYPNLTVTRIKQLEAFKRRFDAFVASVRPPHGDPRQIDGLFDKFLHDNLQYPHNFPDIDGKFPPFPSGDGG